MARRDITIRRCRLAGVIAVEADTRRAFSRHTHDAFGVGVIGRGAQKSLSGRGVVEAGAGDTITVNPGETHDGAPIDEKGRFWRMLYFDTALVADAALDISEGRTRAYEFSTPALRDRALARMFHRLYAAMTAETSCGALRREELTLSLFGALAAPASSGAPRIPAGVRRALALMDEDPGAPLALADLARASGLGRFQLVRAVAAATGLTPHAYLVQARVDLARRLIVGGAPLAQAAAASGFSDQSHMTRAFVRKYGLTPGAYAGLAG